MNLSKNKASISVVIVAFALFCLSCAKKKTTQPMPLPFKLIYQKNGAAPIDQFGYSIDGAGDVDGDGKDDFMVGSPTAQSYLGGIFVYSGATGNLLFQKSGATVEGYGASVAGLGDVNHDGKSDFAVGAITTSPNGINSAGSIFVYSGATGNLMYQLNGSVAHDRLGVAVRGAGDVNGDGTPDLIAAAAGLATGRSGQVYVYSGTDGSLLYQEVGGVGNDRSVDGAGDVNGDGKADFIVGNPSASPGGQYGAGSIYVYSGANGELLFQKDGNGSGDVYGTSVAGAGDVNRDGRDDFMVGAYLANSYSGAAYVYSGADGTLLYQLIGNTNDVMGKSVAGTGDMDQDGKSDFVVGAYGNFSAYVYSGTNGKQLFRLRDSTAHLFGFSVAGAGDVNGDGKFDVIVAAQGADPGGLEDAGSVFVFSYDETSGK